MAEAFRVLKRGGEIWVWSVTVAARKPNAWIAILEKAGFTDNGRALEAAGNSGPYIRGVKP
jgi:hypothetical protein